MGKADHTSFHTSIEQINNSNLDIDNEIDRTWNEISSIVCSYNIKSIVVLLLGIK